MPEIGSIVRLRCIWYANRKVIGQVSRLSPQQAHVVIQIVNNRPVADSTEELTGVVRLSDIR